MNITYTCEICFKEIPAVEEYCPYCMEIPKSQNRITSKLQCKSCGFENDLSNVECVAC